MTTIVTRVGKGSPLTWTEVDTNFTNLNSAKYESGNNATFGTIGGTTITASTGFSGALNGTVGASTPAAGTFTSLSDSGNLTFTGTGNRITGDFSNGTLANRVAFQTSTINGNTSLNILPNGTSTVSAVRALNNQDPTNASSASLVGLSAEVRVESGIFGTGTYLPMAFHTGGSERMRIDTSGNVGIGTTTTGSRLRTAQSSTTTYSFIAQTPTVGLTTGDYVNMAYFTNGRSTNNDGLRIVNLRDSTGSGVGDWGTESYRIRRSVDQNDGSTGVQEEIVFGNTILGFNTGGTERMRIDSSGNVGIGTSSPAQILDVVKSVAAGAVWGSFSNTNATAGSTGGILTSASGANNYSALYNVVGGITYLLGAGAGGLNISTSQAVPIVFNTSASERMRIDSSGNVGIGTSSPLAKTTISFGDAAGNGIAIQNTNTGSVTTKYSGVNYYGTDTVGSNKASGYVRVLPADVNYVNSIMSFGTRIANTEAERMRIDDSGNVGIGTSSPGSKLHVYGNYISLADGSYTGYLGKASNVIASGGVSDLGLSAIGNLAFGTGGSLAERMRITSGGEVYIAGTADQGAYNLQVNGTGVWGAGAYVNGSDERIKEEIAPIDSGLDVVEKLNPVTYRYKEDWSKDQSIQTGFIAQELLVALEGKNYVDGVVQQGGEYMSVAYQNIIPILTKAIQELKAELDVVKSELNTLKGN